MTSPNEYIVAPGKSVFCGMGANKRHLSEGTSLPHDVNPEQLRSWMASGFVVERGRAEALEDVPTPEAILPEGLEAAPVKQKGVWDFDPDSLRDMSVDELNILILETDPSALNRGAEPFERAEDAVRFLSSEFKSQE